MDIKLTSLIGLSVSLLLSLYVFYRTYKSQTYKFNLAALGVVGVLLIAALTGSVIYYQYIYLQRKDTQLVFEDKIKNLDEIKRSLSSLKLYVEDQQRRLKNTEQTIIKLKDEQNKLEPVLKLKREQVEALAEIFENKNFWKDFSIGVISGIISSLLAAIIISLVTVWRRSHRPVPSSSTASVQRLIFYDDFSVFEGWQDYKRGSLDHSVEIKHENKPSLKKVGNDDPHGGYKIFQNPVSRGFVFSGWIYRPSQGGGGKGDRLAIEDSNFNGYGFCISHGNGVVEIELRESGKPSRIKRVDSIISPQDQWYQFKFSVDYGERVGLVLLDVSGNELCKLHADDTRYNSFDRVVVHGGRPYYLSTLKVEKI